MKKRLNKLIIKNNGSNKKIYNTKIKINKE